MARRNKMWLRTPPKKPKVPEALKAELTQKAGKVIEEKFKPWRLETDQGTKEAGFNYVVDIYSIWWRNYFYFCSKYHCPHPRAISEYFEARTTRMEYVGGRRFNLAYMRHTGKWHEVYYDMTLEDCLETIGNEQLFWP